MKLKVLGSSSKGNCYILQNKSSSLLLEAGIRFDEIKRGLDFNYSKVAACLITHEHLDHSKAVRDVLRAGIDVYASKGTIEALLNQKVDMCRLPHQSESEKSFTVGPFTILPFQAQHDAAEPLGFLIKDMNTGEKVLFATDTYYVKYKFPALNYILVECNYCDDILKKNIAMGHVPKSLERRLLESHFSL
jgi:phosphoribosyl 1,2-cyclic phosphodiesterase